MGIEAALDRPLARLAVRVTGHRDEEDLRRAEGPADAGGDLVTVDLRQPDVDQDDARPVPDGFLDAGRAILRDVDPVSPDLEEVLQAFPRIEVVLHHENANGARAAPRVFGVAGRDGGEATGAAGSGDEPGDRRHELGGASGLARCPSKPARRDRRRSSSRAYAVRARAGREPFPSDEPVLVCLLLCRGRRLSWPRGIATKTRVSKRCPKTNSPVSNRSLTPPTSVWTPPDGARSSRRTARWWAGPGCSAGAPTGPFRPRGGGGSRSRRRGRLLAGELPTPALFRRREGVLRLRAGLSIRLGTSRSIGIPEPGIRRGRDRPPARLGVP